MKIVISMKNPDCVSDAVRESAQDFVNEKRPSLAGNAREEAIRAREKSILGQLSKWIEYEEYINVEFDLVTGTAKVLKVNEQD